MLIYSLIDPYTKEVRYIGVTKRTLKERLLGHMRHVRAGSNYHVHNWIRKIKRKPIIQLIEIIPEGRSWKRCEQKWIKFYRSKGCNLTNMTKGGEGIFGFKYSSLGIKRSKETKMKISKALMGRKLSKKTRRKMSISQIGHFVSKETRLKISQNQKRNK